MSQSSDFHQLAFTSSGLDRCGNQRQNSAWVNEIRAKPGSRCLLLYADSCVMADEKTPAQFPAQQYPDAIFLGVDVVGDAWFADAAPSQDNTRDLRSLLMAGQLSGFALSLLAQARALLFWHQRHGFCANCGQPTSIADAGYKRLCKNCGAEHFPRTDPVVIVCVEREDHFLLGRQKSWPWGMYSILAGFMEPGETIEDAARREVFEEAGIRLGDISYMANQPWPFPSSLMIGLHAQASSDTITIDAREIEDARWFSRAEVQAMLAGTHAAGFTVPQAFSIAHHVLQSALAASA